MSVDWYNRDLRYGWRPISEAFRTVRWPLFLHGAALSLLLVVIGVQVVYWPGVLFLLWLGAIPLYLGVPWYVFRGIGSDAKAAALVTLWQERPDSGGITHAASGVPFIEAADIRPLSLTRSGGYAFLLSVALSVVLWLAQLFAERSIFGP